MPLQDEDDNWYELIKQMKAGTVVPVVGPDVLDIGPGQGGANNLYAQVGARLAAEYGIDAAPAVTSPWPLFDYVNLCLERSPASVDKLRRKVARFVSEATDPANPAFAMPATLKTLAGIDAFSLFVSLSCDDLMHRALLEVDAAAFRVAFSIRSDSSDSTLDIPTPPPARGVYQLLGSTGNSLDFVIHEGDALEYVYHMQTQGVRTLRRLLEELRKRNLLFIGCNPPGWMGRSLLRLASHESLSGKKKYEFLGEDRLDSDLVTFMSRFSPNSLIFQRDPAQFVQELAQRWAKERPAGLAQAPAGGFPARPGGNAAPPNGTGPIVFLSYASENRLEATTLADQLIRLGAGDVWLDRRKLRAGDSWADSIELAIERQCDYVMPVLSRQADSRDEGVYWQEWGLAVARSQRVARPFLLPTVVDPDADLPTYLRIGQQLGTQVFFSKHLSRAPQGRLDPQSELTLKQVFAEFQGQQH
jgi:hypothetical protein